MSNRPKGKADKSLSPSPSPNSKPQLISVIPCSGVDSSLPAYSHSRLTNMNYCPTYGVVANQRKYIHSTKPTPLTAGATMHEVFAAVRLWQMQYVQKLPKHALHNAHRLFSPDRWSDCVSHTKDKRDNLIELCFNILHSSGYSDDGNDPVRTITNMETATIAYCDERLPYMEQWPVWVKDKKDHKCQVGIEQPIDAVLIFSDKKRIRYIGTIDGLVCNLNMRRYEVDENKTASRLDEAWRTSFDMSMQQTGYCACSTTVFGFPVLHVRVTGLMLRASRNNDRCLPIEPLPRDATSILHWANWVRHTSELYETYKDDYENAPRYTHSCNRYFRPCGLIPFCCDSADGRRQQWEDMVPADPSPSELAVLGE